jgi:hypothetical protein
LPVFRRREQWPEDPAARVDREYRLRVALRAQVDAPIQDVWDFVESPELATRSRSDVRHALRVPGTGPGVGQIQVFITERRGIRDVYRDVGAVVVEKWDPPVFVQYATLGPEHPVRTALTLAGVGPCATAVEYQVETLCPAGTAWVSVDELRSWYADDVERTLNCVRGAFER